jgi:hypothetical protein
MSPRLIGRSAIVLEPDSFIAGYIGAALIRNGADVACPSRNAGHCATYLDGAVTDAAVLSLDDPEATPWPLAALFTRRAIPMMFLCAARTEIAPDYQHVPYIRKPLASFQIVDAILSLLPHHPIEVQPEAPASPAKGRGFIVGQQSGGIVV